MYGYPALPPDLKVIVASQPDVNQACFADGAEFADDGAPLGPDMEIRGCWSPTTRTIYVSELYPEVLFHELCHAAGLSRTVCARVHY